MPSLTTPTIAYLVGLLQTDGSHSMSSPTKGKIALELAERDLQILVDLHEALPWPTTLTARRRATNFSADYRSRVLHIGVREAREFLLDSGVLVGRKSDRVAPPRGDISTPDYLRGLIDGDGSVGHTSRGIPFISFVTTSDAMAAYFASQIKEVCGVTRTPGRNQRDRAFNIMVTNGPAQALAQFCYYDGCIAIDRKRRAAQEVSQWTAPSTRFGVKRRAWTDKEDAQLLAMSDPAAAKALGRTLKSVQIRKIRLTKAVNY